MKLTTQNQRNRFTIPLKVIILLFFTLYSQVGRSQNQKVTLTGDNITLRTAFNQIEKQTQLTIDYEEFSLDSNKKITNPVKTAKLSDLLAKLLQNTHCSYTIQGSHIVITPTNSKLAKTKLTGLVVDEQGNALIGVGIKVDGTSNGTITDVDGKFSLTLDENSTVLISYIGYETVSYKIDKDTNLKINLKEDTKLLNEVVIVGFGTQKRVNLTGSVATIDGKELQSRPVTNVTQALQGIIPGLNITQSSGNLEGRPNISINGLATIGDGSTGSPLILIDGMEGDINGLNPNDVENVTVLKDASASSIYGSRAPFGVILITTKKGKAGKMEITYDGNFRVNTPLKMPQQMDSYSFAKYYRTAAENSQEAIRFTDAYLQRIKDFQDGKLGKNTIPTNNGTQWADGYDYGNDNVDWFKAMYKSSAPSQEHSVRISGGTDKINYYLSGGYMGQQGLIKLNEDKLSRYTINAKINATLSSWASVSYSGRFSREDYNRPTALTSNLYGNMARQAWPTLPLYDPNGYYYSSPSPALAIADGGKENSQTDWNYQQINLTLEPLKGWKIFGNFNYKTGDVFHHWDVLPTYNHNVAGEPYYAFQQWYFPNDPNPDIHEEATRTNFFSPNIYSEYVTSFGKNNFKLMAGFQSEVNTFRNVSVTRVGVLIPGNPYLDLTSGSDPAGKAVTPVVGGRYEDWATVGYFGRLNYNYEERYLAEVSLRYDGSSRFRQDKRWNWLPSASLGWNVAREDFWKPLVDIVNLFKFRGSYGSLGNQNTNNLYPTYTTMNFTPSGSSWLINDIKTNLTEIPGLVSSTLGWETVKEWNAGVDVGMLNNRLTAMFEYYNRYTNYMVGTGPALPNVLGTTPPKTNNTDMVTRGWNMSLNWQDRLDNKLGYSIGFVLSDNQSEILSYPNNQTEQIDRSYPTQKWGEIWGYQTKGIAKTQDEMDAHLATMVNGAQSVLGNNWGAGDIMYVDLNGDGKIDNGANSLSNHGDLKVIGNNTPRFLFGLNLSADWNGFDFRAFIQGVAKRDYWMGGNMFWGASGQGIWGLVALKQHENYFRPEPTAEQLADPAYVADPLGSNVNAYYPRPVFNGKNTQTQSAYLQDAAYIRLKNIQLGYTIPPRITKKALIQKCRIYVSGDNLLTATKLSSIFDPEAIDGGNGGNVYPINKVLSAGVTITF
jgi:TonB-linked SusC/RagA family outer membrane protein